MLSNSFTFTSSKATPFIRTTSYLNLMSSSVAARPSYYTGGSERVHYKSYSQYHLSWRIWIIFIHSRITWDWELLLTLFHQRCRHCIQTLSMDHDITQIPRKESIKNKQEQVWTFNTSVHLQPLQSFNTSVHLQPLQSFNTSAHLQPLQTFNTSVHLQPFQTFNTSVHLCH